MSKLLCQCVQKGQMAGGIGKSDSVFEKVGQKASGISRD